MDAFSNNCRTWYFVHIIFSQTTSSELFAHLIFGCWHNWRYYILLLPGPKTLFLDRYYFHWRVCICLSVCLCVCVCPCLYRLSQKVLDWFWWNLAGWLIMIKDRFLSKMSSIGSLERKLQRIRIYTYSYYVPWIIFFWGYFPFFIIGEVKCN